MNKVLMSHSLIFKQQSANVVQRSQMTFSRLQCIMYDWTKKKNQFWFSGTTAHTCTQRCRKKKHELEEQYALSISFIFLYKRFILHFSRTEGQSLGQTQIHVFKSCTTGIGSAYFQSYSWHMVHARWNWSACKHKAEKSAIISPSHNNHRSAGARLINSSDCVHGRHAGYFPAQFHLFPAVKY